MLTLWTQLDRMCQGKALDHPPLQHLDTLERPKKSSVIGWVGLELELGWLVGWVVGWLGLLKMLKVCFLLGCLNRTERMSGLAEGKS